MADRLHNMRTIEFMKPAKIEENVKRRWRYMRLWPADWGISTVKFELEDIALKSIFILRNSKIWQEKVSLRRSQREDTINTVIGEIKESLDDMDLHYEIYGRAKHFTAYTRR